MRILLISGRIGTVPKVSKMKDGTKYLTFRLANHEYDDNDRKGNKITYWYKVMAFDPKIVNLAQYLKKGKPINITGRYTDQIYQKKNGDYCVKREIKAKTIDFEISKISYKDSDKIRVSSEDEIPPFMTD